MLRISIYSINKDATLKLTAITHSITIIVIKFNL